MNATVEAKTNHLITKNMDDQNPQAPATEPVAVPVEPVAEPMAPATPAAEPAAPETPAQ